MKVELNIDNDEELRLHIKDLIRGQVKSIVREEFLEIVREEISARIKGTEQKRFDSLLKDSMNTVIEKILRRDFGVGEWYNKFVEPIATKYIDKVASTMKWEQEINVAARKKIASLLDK